MGAHYTGACMGMPYASGAIWPVPAPLPMAPLTHLGAFLASSGVETTVGHRPWADGTVSVGLAAGIVVIAFVPTSFYNLVTIPTSTIHDGVRRCAKVVRIPVHPHPFDGRPSNECPARSCSNGRNVSPAGEVESGNFPHDFPNL